jgi:hypothetical protein
MSGLGAKELNELDASVDGGSDDETGIAVGVTLGAWAALLFCPALLEDAAVDTAGVDDDAGLAQPRKPQTPATITPLHRASSTRASRMYSI